MSDPLKHSSQSAILHVCSSFLAQSEEALAVEQWVTDAALEVVRSEDMYMGLAKAMGKSSGRFVAVIVCTEDCSPSDYEFFSILARARRDLPVYVYGSKSPDRVVRALESGARGLASRDAVAALSSRLAWRADSLQLDTQSAVISPRAASPHDAFIAPAGAPPECLDEGKVCSRDETASFHLSPSKAAVANKDEAAATEAGASHGETEGEDSVAEEADSGASARVPWLRYSGGPERKRPSSSNDERRVSRPDSPAPVAQASNGSARVAPIPCERHYEPLLTEQELAALLGDDLDEMAMQEREMLTGEGEAPGSGTR
jgi:hypothetical protein